MTEVELQWTSKDRDATETHKKKISQNPFLCIFILFFLDNEIETQQNKFDSLFIYFICRFRGSLSFPGSHGGITLSNFSVYLEKFASCIVPLTSKVPQGVSSWSCPLLAILAGNRKQHKIFTTVQTMYGDADD